MLTNHCYLGDCRDVMRDLIAAGVRVQCIVTSPPYWGLRDYGVAGQLGLEPTLREFLTNMVEVFDLCRELLADDGTLWLNMGDSYASSGGPTGPMTGAQFINRQRGKAAICLQNRQAGREAGLKPKDLVGQPWRLAFALQDAGWWLRQDIIWHKPNPMPESVRDRCTKAHEYLFLLTKSDRYSFDSDAIAERATDLRGPGNVNPVRALPGERHSGDNANIRGSLHKIGARETRNKRSVWTIPTQSYSGAHFATFPEALVEPCILAGSRPGDIVFDPFMGSGTVASVAQRLGRRWLGAELNPDYIALQAARTRQHGLMLETSP
ncbi:DNA-methyltransferase [Cupriavidus campinensis]|uniref:Methyltransferase n=1 Tax=Cupriavidus campinensis TaxID=151783 RepID=A0AAE9I0U7_9BURK|nr:site-specific DNA-methyltransferase [Cupriavidus campinensis]URF05447.1 site-specific DNA-methyltransferase [Cupriavidus campinensis]